MTKFDVWKRKEKQRQLKHDKMTEFIKKIDQSNRLMIQK